MRDEFLIVAMKDGKKLEWERSNLASAKRIADVIVDDMDGVYSAEVFNIYGGLKSDCLYVATKGSRVKCPDCDGSTYHMGRNGVELCGVCNASGKVSQMCLVSYAFECLNKEWELDLFRACYKGTK